MLANSIAKIVFMKPKDILGGTNESILSSDAIDFWDALYEGLPKRKKHSFQLFKEAQISVAFDQYCNRISNNNNILLMRICRFLSPISIFKPIIVEVTDLKSSYEIDYIKRKITKTNASSALTMKSEVLYFMFKNSFGFDTMTVNGCFEEGTKGGFTNATKSLAIENLNNLGIYVNLRLLVNFRIIKLFFTRLYRVARKLEY